MFEIATIIIALALSTLTYLVARTVLKGRTTLDRPPQRIGEPVQSSVRLDPYGDMAVPGSPVADGLDAIMAADTHLTSGISPETCGLGISTG